MFEHALALSRAIEFGGIGDVGVREAGQAVVKAGVRAGHAGSVAELRALTAISVRLETFTAFNADKGSTFLTQTTTERASFIDRDTRTGLRRIPIGQNVPLNAGRANPRIPQQA